MSWLNWSLNLHIRLRTISFLIPTHITRVYVQECHIHLCNCTWLNVFHILNFCWSNTKIFLSVLIVFLESLLFLQKFQNFQKTVLPYFGDLVAGQSSRMPPVVSLHRRFSRFTGGSKSLLRKRLRNFFKILDF